MVRHLAVDGPVRSAARMMRSMSRAVNIRSLASAATAKWGLTVVDATVAVVEVQELLEV